MFVCDLCWGIIIGKLLQVTTDHSSIIILKNIYGIILWSTYTYVGVSQLAGTNTLRGNAVPQYSKCLDGRYQYSHNRIFFCLLLWNQGNAGPHHRIIQRVHALWFFNK